MNIILNNSLFYGAAKIYMQKINIHGISLFFLRIYVSIKSKFIWMFLTNLNNPHIARMNDQTSEFCSSVYCCMRFCFLSRTHVIFSLLLILYLPCHCTLLLPTAFMLSYCTYLVYQNSMDSVWNKKNWLHCNGLYKSIDCTMMRRMVISIEANENENIATLWMIISDVAHISAFADNHYTLQIASIIA